MVSPILDLYGRPFEKAELTTPQGGITLSGVRQPYSGGHPAVGLTPQRLARLLRDSVSGDPERYLDLAEDMEERDLHYAGVLGIRKRQVAGLEITIEAATDSTVDQKAADMARELVARDGFEDELIDILDAIGKGYSCTEILWDRSGPTWWPKGLTYSDPRWFRFDMRDLDTLYLRGEAGDEPLRPFTWIVHRSKTKSGLTIRGGLARAVAWNFLFKSFTTKDWAIFCEAYGQPLRLGKYGSGASEDDKDVLLRAVANIGADFAAIVPEAMTIEFIKADIAGSHELYEKRSDWLDRQTSKLVLGQVGTTDAIAGGYAVGKVHDGVREDIERSDARQLAATLNRNLMRPFIDLNFPAGSIGYPKIVIGRPDEVDIDKLVDNVAKLVPLGLKVGMSTMRDKIGMPDPTEDEELLGVPQTETPPASQGKTPGAKGDVPGTKGTAFSAARASAERAAQSQDLIDAGVDELADGWTPGVEEIVAGLEERLVGVTTEEELAAVLADQLRTVDPRMFADALAKAMFAAKVAGDGGVKLAD